MNMTFIEAFEQGKVEELGLPDRVIQSHISRLFVFGERVFKVYKDERFFFADMTQAGSRKEFFSEDFFWNNAAAPEIYRHLWGVAKNDGIYILVPPSMGEHFAIEMSKVDDSKTLTKLLTAGVLTKQHTELFIDALVDTLATLTRERKSRLEYLFNKGLIAIMQEDIGSLHTWMYGADPLIPKAHTDKLKNLLFAGIEHEPYFKDMPLGLSAAIDSNSDNLLILDGKASFIDIMPPMVIWRVVDEYSTISRTIVDIEVLGGAELGAHVRAYYAKYKKGLPTIALLVHEIRACGIQWSYRHMLKQHEVAEKFGNAAKSKMRELEVLLA